MSFSLANEMAVIRHLASSGDKVADALVKVYDALRAEGKEVVIVDAASTGNLALSGTSAVDGVTIAAGSIVLAKDQTTDSQNGIYVVHAGAWTRLTNFNEDTVLRLGMAVYVKAGTTNVGSVWYCTTFTTVGSTVAFTTFTAATLGAGSVGTTELANLSVTSGKLAAAVATKMFGTPALAVGAEGGGNDIVVTITLKDITGTALAAAAAATVWISDTPGGALCATAPDGGVSITTGTSLNEDVADKLIRAVSNASGVIGVTVVDSGTPTFYVNVAVGDIVASSAAVTFA